MSRFLSLVLANLAVLFLFSFFVTPSYADHSWGNYHWARTANPFTIKLGDNLSANWDAYLSTASADWNQSTVLKTQVTAGHTTARRCRATTGMVEICNDRYGNNGWLGIAQIWASGNHITQGVVKMNDTYYLTAKYNTPAWRNLVMCQEVGHTFGLDHQDETFDNPNLGTCMDYTNNPESNQHPNFHDYEQLVSIYSHLDTFTTVGQTQLKSANGELHNRSEWGRQIRNNGHVAVFERDLGKGNKVLTHVFWVQE